MKKYGFLFLVLAIVIGCVVMPALPASASFNKDLIMDDAVFEDSGSMSASSIDAWLTDFGLSCIKSSTGFRTPQPLGWSPSQGKYLFGGNVTAGQAIYSTAQIYHVNPQVILATLQKEQSIPSGSAGCHYNSPDPATATPMTDACGGGVRNCTVACVYSGGCMNIALGYGCPNYCESKDEGFSMQLTLGTWLLRFAQQRSQGNLTGYVGYESGDENFRYDGPMTPGVRQRISGGASVGYDGSYTTANGVGVTIGSGATASLYNFTPFTSGNTSFVNIFEGWFGSTISAGYYSCRGTSNIGGGGHGVRIVPNRPSWGADLLSLSQMNDTSSACIEVHTWSSGTLQTWLQHVATNRGSIYPNDARILSADTNGDGKDELMDVEYRNTGSGRIEFHVWDPSYQRWIAHVASNRAAIDPGDAEVIAADTNADGKDELYLVQYWHTSSGKVEIHGWSPDVQQWTSHVATNLPAIDPGNCEIIAGDTNGDGKDEFFLVQYRATNSGNIEVHGWTPNLQQWVSHIATNRPAIDPGIRTTPWSEVILADTNGDARDEFKLIQYHDTSSARIEVHTWTPNLQQWVSHIATPQGSYY